ncbi:hypothetical protein ACN27F_23105 [Solwaraspora sp. WMMB335]|uniref:hypothetical protein n=1 Tax=Solwaraspora sp. WMMB335 TaxID=3404118 RepID=UPI003B9438C8
MDHAGPSDTSVVDACPSDVLPLRPLTTGELLDSAVALLRGYAPVLLPAGALGALAEQLVLLPLRTAAGVSPPAYLPTWHRLDIYWLLLATGAACEMVLIALLGGLASRAAGAAALGHRLPAHRLLDPRGSRCAAVVLVAGAGGVVMFSAALAGPVWFVAYAVLGLAVPALVLDRVPVWQSLSRSTALACRAGLRAGLIRILGYLVWLAVRAGLGFGALTLLEAGSLDGQARWLAAASLVGWTAINAIAYPALACLDALLHVETRIRTEGLDIRLRRARTSGSRRTADQLVPSR